MMALYVYIKGGGGNYSRFTCKNVTDAAKVFLDSLFCFVSKPAFR